MHRHALPFLAVPLGLLLFGLVSRPPLTAWEEGGRAMPVALGSSLLLCAAVAGVLEGSRRSHAWWAWVSLVPPLGFTAALLQVRTLELRALLPVEASPWTELSAAEGRALAAGVAASSWGPVLGLVLAGAAGLTACALLASAAREEEPQRRAQRLGPMLAHAALAVWMLTFAWTERLTADGWRALADTRPEAHGALMQATLDGLAVAEKMKRPVAWLTIAVFLVGALLLWRQRRLAPVPLVAGAIVISGLAWMTSTPMVLLDAEHAYESSHPGTGLASVSGQVTGEPPRLRVGRRLLLDGQPLAPGSALDGLAPDSPPTTALERVVRVAVDQDANADKLDHLLSKAILAGYTRAELVGVHVAGPRDPSPLTPRVFDLAFHRLELVAVSLRRVGRSSAATFAEARAPAAGRVVEMELDTRAPLELLGTLEALHAQGRELAFFLWSRPSRLAPAPESPATPAPRDAWFLPLLGRVTTPVPAHRALIQETLWRYRREVHQCGASNPPGLDGALELHLSLGPRGRVTRVVPHGSSHQSEAVQACLVSHAQRWSFPELAGGRAVHATAAFGWLEPRDGE